MKAYQTELKYQIKDAIKYTGINPKTSGGWIDEVLEPIAHDLINRIEEKVLPKYREFLIKELEK